MEIKQKIIIGISGHIHTDQRMKRIATSLSKHGANVCLYYRDYVKHGDTHPSDTLPFETQAMHLWAKQGVLFYLLLNWHLFTRLLFKKMDVLYAVDADTLPAMTLLSILKRKRLIYDAHEYFCEVPELKNHSLKKSIWDKVTLWGVRQAWKCISVGPMLAKELERRYGKPFAVVRNTTVLEDAPSSNVTLPFILPDQPVLIYQGALNKGRELELLIQAMKELPDMYCVLAGEGDLSIHLRDLAKGMQNIHFTGVLSPQTLKVLTPQCFAGYNLLDAEGSLSYYYSLSNKYFDYIHAGIPSISSYLPEYEALNASTGAGACIENTKDALIKTLQSWHTDKALYQKFRENTNIARNVYHWKTDESTLLDLFRS